MYRATGMVLLSRNPLYAARIFRREERSNAAISVALTK